MKSLYNSDRTVPTILQWIGAILCGTAYVVCCLPSFYRIGQFMQQTVFSIILSLICTTVLFFLLPRSLQMIGRGLSLFLAAMLLYALYEQIVAHVQSGVKDLWWIRTFFYDRPFTIALVWCTAFASILLLRLCTPYSDTYAVFRTDFARFFRTSFRVFLVFYFCLLAYCFVLQRKPGVDGGLNLVPFAVFFSYFHSFKTAYETIFYFLGNLLCFLPLGFYLCICKKAHFTIQHLLLPVVVSLLIESSQLVLSTGDFDVDDIWMNAVGFYIGWAIALLFDFLRCKRTAGEEKTIFSPPA